MRSWRPWPATAPSAAPRSITSSRRSGGWPDYSVFQGFPPLRLFEKHDPYRFQVHQMRTHPHSYESIDVPNLYAGGYLAQDIGLVVIAMHGTTYAIAGDILQKERMIP